MTVKYLSNRKNIFLSQCAQRLDLIYWKLLAQYISRLLQQLSFSELSFSKVQNFETRLRFFFMLDDRFVDRLMLTGKPELWQLWWKVLCASVSFENAVSPYVLRNCLNCSGCRGKVLNLTTKSPLYVYHFLRMSTSFYLFWPSKSLLLLFWIRELGDAKETILNQEDSRKRAPLFRNSIPRSSVF